MSSFYDVIILGAGAAGLMCAIEAGRRGRSVLVIERNNKVGEKIRISGGGRCNFTNSNTVVDNYLSQNSHFCTSALARFTPNDFISLLEKHGIEYHEKKLGQLFCDSSSQDILNMLITECKQVNVELKTGCDILSVIHDPGFMIKTNSGEYKSTSLVVATGGVSIPKLGATDFGYRIAQQFGLNIILPKPGLVPLVCKRKDAEFCNKLSGVSFDAIVSCNNKSFREGVLFTHKGLSGPAILQLSSYWNEGNTITINCSPDVDLLSLFKENHQTRKELVTILADILPRRFAQLWCETYVEQKFMNQYSLKELASIALQLHQWNIVPATTEGFGKAEVTCGGVDTYELSSKTMEAKKIPGLYFIGEVVDVTGELGGYNFQWAWASGIAAGKWV
jgi:predicted Rossmann fold flavoprotein